VTEAFEVGFDLKRTIRARVALAIRNNPSGLTLTELADEADCSEEQATIAIRSLRDGRDKPDKWGIHKWDFGPEEPMVVLALKKEFEEGDDEDEDRPWLYTEATDVSHTTAVDRYRGWRVRALYSAVKRIQVMFARFDALCGEDASLRIVRRHIGYVVDELAELLDDAAA
jgi:hypothetical protein